MKLVMHQKQQVNLSMTTELRQAIELLQYSTYELEQYIRQQELENPLIELKEDSASNLSDTKVYQHTASSNHSDVFLEALPYHNLNMRDLLFEKVKLIYSDQATQCLLSNLIDNLDDNGYLLPYEQIALPHTKQEIDHGIHLLQEVGPLGIGARNLTECLLLQIEYTSPENRLAKQLVMNHLHLIAERKWTQLAEKMNLSMKKVKELQDYIQTLNPRPCSFVADTSTQYVTPDIIIESKDGELVFQINDGYLPGIQLNSHYEPFLKDKNEISSYMNKQYSNFKWLLNSIEQRRNTIIKIVQALLVRQESFFKNGFSSLKPLTMKEIADDIEMHESTVSRATNNKIIQTSFGSFELRLLFSSKVSTTKGDDVSQMKVKALLQELIDDENKQKPYSDQKIVDLLKSERGLSISRRTIAKYRKELNIPASSQRKEIQT